MLHLLSGTYEVIDPWFGRPHCPLEFDMGCGFGRYTLELARRFPDRLVLGSDLHPGRLRKIAARADRRGIGNAEFLYVNNLALVGYLLPDGCVSRLHLLCPDPWPKARHRARRLVTSAFLTRAARILAPGGVLHLATDHEPYLASLQEVVASLPFFRPAPEAIADVLDLQTDFEKIWLHLGKTVPHLAYMRQEDRP